MVSNHVVQVKLIMIYKYNLKYIKSNYNNSYHKVVIILGIIH